MYQIDVYDTGEPRSYFGPELHTAPDYLKQLRAFDQGSPRRTVGQFYSVNSRHMPSCFQAGRISVFHPSPFIQRELEEYILGGRPAYDLWLFLVYLKGLPASRGFRDCMRILWRREELRPALAHACRYFLAFERRLK